MEGGALLRDEFIAFAKDYVLFCHITSRVTTDKHQDLLEKKGGRGFPYLIFMDHEGNVIATHQGPRTGTAFAETGGQARAYLDLKAKAAKGDKATKIELLLVQAELGILQADDAREAIKKLGDLSEEQQKRLDVVFVSRDVRKVLESVTQDPETHIAAGRKFFTMKESKWPPPRDPELAQGYWILMMSYAEKERDLETFTEALAALRAMFGNNPRAASFFATQEKRLEAIRSVVEKQKAEEEKTQ